MHQGQENRYIIPLSLKGPLLSKVLHLFAVPHELLPFSGGGGLRWSGSFRICYDPSNPSSTFHPCFRVGSSSIIAFEHFRRKKTWLFFGSKFLIVKVFGTQKLQLAIEKKNHSSEISRSSNAVIILIPDNCSKKLHQSYMLNNYLKNSRNSSFQIEVYFLTFLLSEKFFVKSHCYAKSGVLAGCCSCNGTIYKLAFFKKIIPVLQLPNCNF